LNLFCLKQLTDRPSDAACSVQWVQRIASKFRAFMNYPSLSLFLLLTACGLGLPAFAEKADRAKPMVFEANTMRFDDVKQVTVIDGTLADAKTIYRRDFWDRAQCDKLHPDLAFDLFDGAVNSGIGQAIRWLQRAVGVADDGVVGPLTLASINRENDTSAIRARYNGHRLDFMTRLSTWDVFGKGWARRIASNLQSVGK
jgi:hypothetical protein